MVCRGQSPYEQLRADFGMSQVPSQLAASGRETAAGLLAQLGLGGLAEQTKLETLRNNLLAQQYQTAAGLFGGQGGTGGTVGGIDPNSILGQVTSGAGNWLSNTLGGLFGGSSTPTDSLGNTAGSNVLNYLSNTLNGSSGIDWLSGGGGLGLPSGTSASTNISNMLGSANSFADIGNVNLQTTGINPLDPSLFTIQG